MRTSAVNANARRRRKTRSQVLYRRFSLATVKKIIFTDLNPLDYSICDILQELVYEGRREQFANLKDLQNVIRDKWHDVDDQTVRKAILQWKKRLSAVNKKNGGPISTFSANQLTDDYCDVLV